MTIGERIKQLRRQLSLNQTEFGKKIGLKQTAIGMYENNQRAVSDSTALLICNMYGVNDEWLRTGAGEMFRHDNSNIVGLLVHEYGLDDVDRAIIERYLQLDAAQRAVIKQYIESLTSAFYPKAAAPADSSLAAIAAMQDYAAMVADEKEDAAKSSTSAG